MSQFKAKPKKVPKSLRSRVVEDHLEFMCYAVKTNVLTLLIVQNVKIYINKIMLKIGHVQTITLF